MSGTRGAATFRTPAQAYDRHVGRYGRELARALCDAAGVRPAQRALDVGCGPGALASELVTRVGAYHVAAVDPSPPFADACRQRLPGVRVEDASAERLPFEDGEFAALRDELQRRLGVTGAPFRLTARGWIVTGRSR